MIIKIVHVEFVLQDSQTTFTFELDNEDEVKIANKAIKDFKAGLWDKEEPKSAD